MSPTVSRVVPLGSDGDRPRYALWAVFFHDAERVCVSYDRGVLAAHRGPDDVLFNEQIAERDCPPPPWPEVAEILGPRGAGLFEWGEMTA